MWQRFSRSVEIEQMRELEEGLRNALNESIKDQLQEQTAKEEVIEEKSQIEAYLREEQQNNKSLKQQLVILDRNVRTLQAADDPSSGTAATRGRTRSPAIKRAAAATEKAAPAVNTAAARRLQREENTKGILEKFDLQHFATLGTTTCRAPLATGVVGPVSGYSSTAPSFAVQATNNPAVPSPFLTGTAHANFSISTPRGPSTEPSVSFAAAAGLTRGGPPPLEESEAGDEEEEEQDNDEDEIGY